MALRGLGSPKMVDRVIRDRAAMLLHRTEHLKVRGQGNCLRAELKPDKISNIVINAFSLFNGCPATNLHGHVTIT